jgi:hypothetical protein
MSTQINFHVMMVTDDPELAKRIEELSHAFRNGMTFSILDTMRWATPDKTVQLSIRGPEVAHLFP